MLDETGVLTADGTKVLTHDIFWMLGFAAVLIPLAFIPKRFIIGRYKGFLIVIAYTIFISLAFSG